MYNKYKEMLFNWKKYNHIKDKYLNERKKFFENNWNLHFAIY